MKRVVFVIGVLSDGGAERVISVLAKQFVSMGYKVDIATIYGDRNDYIEDSSIGIKPIIHETKNKLFRAIEIIFKLRKFIKRKNPDLVISFVAIVNLYTILSCFFLKVRLIVSERNDPYQNPESKPLRKLRNLLYRFCDGYVFQTDDAKRYFSNNIQKKGTVIPNPITSELPYWDRSNTEKVIISACRLVKQKNLPMMIHAFERLKKEFPEYKLKIYGIGELREELLSLINEIGLTDDISLPGFSINIHKEMVKSELFVLSSNYEGISNSMLEALAIGVPVVTTDSPTGGARMFIQSGENGILTDVGDTNQLFKAMKQIISDKQFASNLSKEATKVRNELSSEIIAKKWNEYIVRTCEGNNAKSI